MKKTPSKREDIRPALGDLQRAARQVGEALARARGRDPQSFLHGLPSWYSMLPPALATLFCRDEVLWTEIATHHGMTLDEWRHSSHELFEPMPRRLENRLISSLQDAVKSGVRPGPSADARVCGICESAIPIGEPSVKLPVTRSKSVAICGSCFDVFRIAPPNRPME